MRDSITGLFAAAALATIVSAPPAFAQAEVCASLLPDPAEALADARALKPEDLVRLRDIGSLPEFHDTAPAFALSPDGHMLAFQIRRADPARNGYCQGIVVMEMRAGAKPFLVDRGGELIRWTYPSASGRADIPSGFARIITPRWSTDGKSVTFLKKVDNVVQLWRADITSRTSAPLAHSDTDILDFRLSADGKSIIYSTRPALAEARAAIAREGLSGWHYDERFSPVAGDAPFVPAPVPTQTLVWDGVTGHTRPAEKLETAMLAPLPADAPQGVIALGISSHGRKAWTRASSGSTFPPPNQLVVEETNGRRTVCDKPECDATEPKLWWTTDSRAVRYMRREGWGREATAIYTWSPGSTPRRLNLTNDLLVECQPAGDELICLHESSTTPRRLIRLDPASGRTTTLFDPNPEFARLSLGRAERLHWKTAFGVEAFGDLVLPVGYQPGKRYPLIVVQYITRQFLRGGVGDEFPIQAFANNGYAVLSLQNPKSPDCCRDAKSWRDVDKADLVDFRQRRNILSSTETAVRLLIERGIVDADHVGITGLSDGTSSVQFAALNSKMFAAGAVSSCCWEKSQGAILGPAIARAYREIGWPALIEDAPNFWSRISIAQNPERVAFPLLMQAPDDEYQAGLESFTALREAGKAVDLFVFPDEHHVKWQPAHRLAVYRRNLAWFDFWLKGQLPSDPDRRVEAERWLAMKKITAQDGTAQPIE